MTRSDGVFFYTHISSLQQYSSNNFGGLLPSQGGGSGLVPAVVQLRTIAIQESSQVLNILLHILYGLNCERYAPNLDVIAHILESCFPRYGLQTIGAGDPSGIGAMILKHAPSAPIRAYGLAASLGLEAICVATSQFTFQVTMDTVSEADALRMGAVYLLRLFLLHTNVLDTLKRLLANLPSLHDPNKSCTSAGQQKLVEAWREAAGSIILQPAPQRTTTTDLIIAFGPVRGRTACPRCRECCQRRTTQMIREWETLKRTI
ncbi:hypothetical protein FRC04_003608 [Tulasnella sp. 424]|nr:hypothetical protein FRC04_003608 [Tulasnella sp. 424]KAG8965259.1 hypothetical protein FRC05_003310 [Tulasnella sp. 425]